MYRTIQALFDIRQINLLTNGYGCCEYFMPDSDAVKEMLCFVYVLPKGEHFHALYNVY